MAGVQPGNGAIAADHTGVRPQGHLECADVANRQQGDVPPKVLFGHQQTLAFALQHLAERRQGHAFGTSIEQRNAELLLQQLDTFTECRLRNAQRFGGLTKVCVFDQCQELAQAARGHGITFMLSILRETEFFVIR
ncbi:hypothetical protein D9M71_516220 [compost metagenome]